MLLVLILLPLVQSCTALPAEERSFAVVLGVDGGAEGLTVMARVPVYQSGGGYATLQGHGADIEAALQNLEASAPMHLHTGQLRLVVLTHDLMADGRGAGVIRWLGRQHDVRLQAQAAVTHEDLKILMEAMKPSTGERLSKSVDVLVEARQRQGLAPQAQLADVCRMGHGQTPVLMQLVLHSGAVEVEGGWALDASGLPAVRLDGQEMQLLSLMMGQMKSGELTLAGRSVRVMEASGRAELTGMPPDGATVQFHLVCGEKEGLKNAQEVLAQQALALVSRLATAGADPLGLGRQAVRQCRDMEQWRELDWTRRVKKIQWRVLAGMEPAA